MATEYLEYPRCLHKPGGAICIVQNDTERAEKLAEGWNLLPGLPPVVEPEPPHAPPPAPSPATLGPEGPPVPSKSKKKT